MKRLLAVVLTLPVVIAADSRSAIDADALLTHVKFLSSDELEGRGNGTKGLERAAEYIAGQFKAAGLKPGGTNGTWFQPFELVTGLTVGEPNRLTLRSRGVSVSLMLGETYFPLSVTATDSPRFASAQLSNLPIVFAGHGISAPALSYDDYKQATTLMRGDRRGAVVDERRRLTEELRSWMLWHIARYPSLAPLYLRTIEP